MARKVVVSTAEALIPARPTLNSVRIAAADCQACDLWKKGTQTVFGEGSAHSDLMLVGERQRFIDDLKKVVPLLA